MKPLTSRPHTVWIEDDLWNAALKLGPAREVVNHALDSYLSPANISKAREDIWGPDPIVTAGNIDPATIPGVTKGMPAILTGRQLFEQRQAEEARKAHLRSHPEDESQDPEDLL